MNLLKRQFLLLLCFVATAGFSQNEQEKGWLLEATSSQGYVGITVANGRIGILPSSEPFKISSVILNNVYEQESELGVSKIVAGLNFMNLRMLVDGEEIKSANISDWKQVLDMKTASFTTSFTFKNKATISYTYYAMRNLPYVVMNDVQVTADEPITISVFGAITASNELKDNLNSFRIMQDLEARMPVMQTVVKTRFDKHTMAASTTFMFEGKTPELKHNVIDLRHHELSFTKTIGKNETYNFAWAGSICTTQDFEDPQSESERFVIYTMLNDKQMLLNQHKKAWEQLWKSDIEIEGDLASQLDVRLALYHLYSFSRADSDLSIAPMGLSSRGYNGHIFWDTELWMYPPLLVLNQGIANSLLNYRFNKLEKAKQRAMTYGFKGAMFPWESDETGEEATPTWALTGTFEHHITADIGIAFWNYYRITQDKKWLAKKGYPMIKEVADFWVSRALKNHDGSYSINNVVGANEFAHHANDNAFTNGSAKTILEFAVKASVIVGEKENPAWKDVADNLVFNTMENGVTKEHRSYNGEIIKQVDVNLLAYPLEIITKKKAIQRDIEYYEPKLAPEGPAMSHSVLAVLYARMGDADTAYRLFKRSYEPNKRAPFGALSESATSNNPYFATGAGGMLQTVLFGFGGLHLTDEGLIQKEAVLPKQWKSLTLKGIGLNKETFTIKQ
ncbi:MAG: glycosyl hydrolase family 65 [Flavobacteriaceae bacterium]|nr:MAG: glycosyl hydrolase family 65 [Flavobacteriaceae bacterium]